ncbi:MAG: hypothetical protein WCJ49_01605, partial [Deltaproteobacteria bacterium]
MLRETLLILTTACCILFGQPKFGFSSDGNQPNQWNPSSAGPLITWTAPVCSRGSFIIKPTVTYSKVRGSFDSESNYVPLPNGDEKHQYQQQLFMQYGVTDKI